MKAKMIPQMQGTMMATRGTSFAFDTDDDDDDGDSAGTLHQDDEVAP